MLGKRFEMTAVRAFRQRISRRLPISRIPLDGRTIVHRLPARHRRTQSGPRRSSAELTAFLAEAQRLSQDRQLLLDLVATDEHHWSEEFYRIFEFDPGRTSDARR